MNISHLESHTEIEVLYSEPQSDIAAELSFMIDDAATMVHIYHLHTMYIEFQISDTLFGVLEYGYYFGDVSTTYFGARIWTEDGLCVYSISM